MKFLCERVARMLGTSNPHHTRTGAALTASFFGFARARIWRNSHRPFEKPTFPPFLFFTRRRISSLRRSIVLPANSDAFEIFPLLTRTTAAACAWGPAFVWRPISARWRTAAGREGDSLALSPFVDLREQIGEEPHANQRALARRNRSSTILLRHLSSSVYFSHHRTTDRSLQRESPPPGKIMIQTTRFRAEKRKALATYSTQRVI